MDLQEYRDAISTWTDVLLTSYVDRIAALDVGDIAVKEVNDPLWGTVTLRPEEVIILDSPLLQRLRRIRQLGVVHLVYPSANHTRHEHSIGVCHQVGRIADSIVQHAVTGDATIDQEDVRLLRITALCHDVGHGCLSHVIENALKNDRETRVLLQQFVEDKELDTQPHLSEVAAYFMLRSNGFGNLLEQAHRIAKLPFDKNMSEKMANILIGQPISDEFPLLHELISGPFDADKLDYMQRDAMMAGIPVVTDIGRLIQKVRAVRLRSHELPFSLKEQVHQSKKGHLLVGLAQSGASTLDELAIGRSLMFDKVYRHHKVRAAEAMVAAIVDSLGPSLTDNLPVLPLQLYDEDVLHLDLRRLRVATGQDFKTTDELDDLMRVGLDIGERLSNRCIFVRAFAFSQHLPEDPYRGQESHRRALDSLMRSAAKADTRRELVSDIAGKVVQMIDALQVDTLPDLVVNNIARYIWIDPPSSGHPDAKPDPSRAYIIGSDGKPREVKHVSAEQRGWVDAYTNTHDMGYVFTIAELAMFVAIATRIVVFERHNLRVPTTWVLHTKLDQQALSKVDQTLLANGFYDSVPPLLRPHDINVTRVIDDDRITEVVKRLAAIQSPTADPAALTETGINGDRVRDWVKQFGPQYEASALTLAENVRVLGRKETNAALDRFFASPDGAEFRQGKIVPIGQPKDGSAVVGYHAVDVAAKYGSRVMDIAQALSEEGPIVFVDDFIGRGSSTISIFEAMLGVEASVNLREERPAPLNESTIAHLKQCPIAFVYTAGLDEGPENLRKRLGQIGLSEDSPIFVDVPQRELPTVRSVLDGNHESFLERAGEIGWQLLEGSSEATRSQRQLGYGNHGLLVAFPYNTPSATLTAVWKAGKVDGWPWYPLLVRRKKQ